MALATPLTPELIHQTADQLQAEGIRPTQNNVRERLGGGSFTTIAAAMKSWQAQKAEVAQLEKVTIPDDLKERLRLLGAEAWETAQTLANERLQKEREALQHKEALMLDELEEYKQTISTLEAEQADNLTMLDDMTAQLDTAKANNLEQSKQISELNEATIEQGNKTQALNEKLTAERDKSATLQDKLDQATAQATALTGDNARLTADLQHAQTDNSRLKAELEKVKKDLTTVTNNALADKDKHQTAYADLQAQNAKLNGMLETLQNQQQQGIAREGLLQTKVDELNKLVNDLSVKNAKLESKPTK